MTDRVSPCNFGSNFRIFEQCAPTLLRSEKRKREKERDRERERERERESKWRGMVKNWRAQGHSFVTAKVFGINLR